MTKQSLPSTNEAFQKNVAGAHLQMGIIGEIHWIPKQKHYGSAHVWMG